MSKTSFTLAQLIEKLDPEEISNLADLTQIQLETPVIGLATLQQATPSEVSFLANPRYQKDLAETQAGAVLVSEKYRGSCPTDTIALVSRNPYLSFAKLTELFAYQPLTKNAAFIHPTAIIAKTAQLGSNVVIGAYCVIGENVKLGDGCQLASHVTIADYASVGDNCQLSAFAYVAHHCQLGANVTLHSHASVGNAGFGYVPRGDTTNLAAAGWQQIHQLGKVIIGDNVRVGSQTCIDRGALGDTVIEDNVIIDNLVQIAHNVHIGAGTAIAGCVGIAGSSKIGKRCVLAGGVGLVGHIELCDDVTITGMTMVTKSITQPGSYSSGTPMLPTTLWRKMAVKLKNLV